jgi:hypothetical protein
MMKTAMTKKAAPNTWTKIIKYKIETVEIIENKLKK